MKKIVYSLILFLFLPITVLAANYDIEHYYIDAKILNNGDMEVTELIVMDGTFNGYEVGISYSKYSEYGASGLTDIYIGGKSNVKNVSWNTLNEDFNDFSKVVSASNGESLKYIETLGSSFNNYRMYYKTNNSTTAFLFKYTLKDVAILHEDVVEVYWNFFSDSFQDDVRDLQIRVSFPKNINKEDFNWWFHGNLAGNSSYTNNYVLAELKKLDAYSPVDFRVLLPIDIFDTTSISKVDNKVVKDSIIETEDEIVANDLAFIKRSRNIYYSVIILTVIFYITLVITIIYVYKKYDKERKPKFLHKYNREFIDDYNVEVIDYLMNRDITPNAMSASIMNLIYKKNISYEEIGDGKKKDYKFTLVNKDKLNETEIKLVEFLFERVGKDNSFTTKELKSYASGTKTCDTFMKTYTAWKKQVESDAEAQHFFEKNKTAKYGIIMLLFSIFIIFIGGINNVQFIPAYISVFAAIMFIIYLSCLSKKTEKGIDHFAKWNAFKNFLNDFGTFELKELPEIVLWERYLVYAVIFGLADKVQKNMNVKISEMDMSSMNGNVYIMPHIHVAPFINSAVRSSYNGAQTAINRNIANASGGSFGGHGGGFSSGGGFGGGGRSGGGF